MSESGWVVPSMPTLRSNSRVAAHTRVKNSASGVPRAAISSSAVWSKTAWSRVSGAQGTTVMSKPAANTALAASGST